MPAEQAEGRRSGVGELPSEQAPSLPAFLAALRSSAARGSTGLTALALLVGTGAGAGAIAFRYMILGLTYVFSGHRDYSAAGHAPDPWVPGLGIWFLVIAPVLGARGADRADRLGARIRDRAGAASL